MQAYLNASAIGQFWNDKKRFATLTSGQPGTWLILAALIAFYVAGYLVSALGIFGDVYLVNALNLELHGDLDCIDDGFCGVILCLKWGFRNIHAAKVPECEVERELG